MICAPAGGRLIICVLPNDCSMICARAMIAP